MKGISYTVRCLFIDVRVNDIILAKLLKNMIMEKRIGLGVRPISINIFTFCIKSVFKTEKQNQVNGVC